MVKIIRFVVTTAFVSAIAACSRSTNPGSLAGKWQMSGAMSMTITFRSGETESLGIIEKVSYKTEGLDVLVTYTDGMARGMTMRYTMTGADSARTEMGSLQRVRR